MNINARANHISHSPRKINLVVKTIVGLPAQKALEKLEFTLKRASHPVSRVLKQAIGNAITNYRLDAKNLVVEQAYATKGRTLKRGLFGGRSRYKPFERVASHLTISLRAVTPRIVQAKPTPQKAIASTPEITKQPKSSKRPKSLKS